MNTYYLKPGYIYVSKNPILIKSILGPCVSICIYDIKLKYGGANHYLLPGTSKYTENSTRYGIISNRLLIKTMINYGSSVKNLSARIIGGACLNHINSNCKLDPDIHAGNKNILLAKKFLNKNKIYIKSDDTGGFKYRKFVYNTYDDKLTIKYGPVRT